MLSVCQRSLSDPGHLQWTINGQISCRYDFIDHDLATKLGLSFIGRAHFQAAQGLRESVDSLKAVKSISDVIHCCLLTLCK